MLILQGKEKQKSFPRYTVNRKQLAVYRGFHLLSKYDFFPIFHLTLIEISWRFDTLKIVFI